MRTRHLAATAALDVSGYFSASAANLDVPVTPFRALDTHDAPQGP